VDIALMTGRGLVDQGSADIFLFAGAYRLTGAHPTFYPPSGSRGLFPEP